LYNNGKWIRPQLKEAGYSRDTIARVLPEGARRKYVRKSDNDITEQEQQEQEQEEEDSLTP
jgi:hypothetical protein